MIEKEFNIQFLLLLGESINILDNSNEQEELPKLFKFLANNGFEPYKNSMTRLRHKSGHNYSIQFLHKLLEHTGFNLYFFAKEFKYNYSDNIVAEEFNIKRNMFLYLKQKYMKSYQILCDAYAFKASNLDTKFYNLRKNIARNESQNILFLIQNAIYSGGNSQIGLSSIAKRLNKCGLKGYKTHNSINKAFVSNNAKVRYIGDILKCYDIDYKLIQNKKEFIEKKELIKYSEKEIAEKILEIYDIDIKKIKGLNINSLNFNMEEKHQILTEAINFRSV